VYYVVRSRNRAGLNFKNLQPKAPNLLDNGDYRKSNFADLAFSIPNRHSVNFKFGAYRTIIGENTPSSGRSAWLRIASSPIDNIRPAELQASDAYWPTTART
jgi:hypothetical protein